MKTLPIPIPLLLVLVLAGLLAACGEADPPAAAPRPGAAPAARSAAGPELRCPPKIASAVDGPDVVGITLGLTRDEAVALARCANPAVAMTPKTQWVAQLRTHGQKLDAQAVELQAGDSEPCVWKPTSLGERDRCIGHLRWTHVAERMVLATPGVPGDERVRGLWRTQRFRAGEMPALEAALEAVTAKYGAGFEREGARLSRYEDAAGRPLTAAQARARRCTGIRPRPDAPQSWADDCGLTIVAEALPARSNPALAAEVHVAVVHQRRLFEATDGLQAELDRRDQARREAELKSAAGAQVKL